MKFIVRGVELAYKFLNKHAPVKLDVERKEGCMYRVAVVGNCQVEGLSACLSYFLSNGYVKTVLNWETEKWYPNQSDFISDLKTFDVVFLQNSFGGWVTEDFKVTLDENSISYIEFPTISFPAFHPDLIYINLEKGGFHNGPIGVYNSAIALLAYKLGLSQAKAIRLFTREIYKKLGYFEFWNPSVDQLVEEAKKFDLDLRSDVYHWVRTGSFMYSINHAKLNVFASLGRGLLKKSGIDDLRVFDINYVEDTAKKDAIWPVYPEIGELYGVKGNYVFKKPDYATTNQFDKYYDLDSFVSESYKAFSFFPRKDLSNPRVSEWLNNPHLVQFVLNF